ncbi:MAG: GspH/FimT family pseudopilin [bacterium]
MNIIKKIKNGFSLIEILTVIGILAILAVIILSFLQQYQPTMKLRGEARELASEMRYAQQLTLTEQIIHLVRFFPADKKYQVIKAPAGQNEEVIKEITLQTPVIFKEITFTDNEVSFNSSGASSESGQVVLTNNEKDITVEVKPSGYIKIIE